MSLLYDDFDAPVLVRPEPPGHDAAGQEALDSAVEAARADAFSEGFRAGAASRDADIDALLDRTEHLIAENIGALCSNVERAAADAADAFARLLFGVLAAALPATCAQNGPAEAAWFAREILPLLRLEPDIAVRVHASAQAEMQAVLAEMPPDIRARVALRLCAETPPGDIEIGWNGGRAARNAAVILGEITAILEKLDLAFPPAKPSAPPAAQIRA
jgi:hypothetical protein